MREEAQTSGGGGHTRGIRPTWSSSVGAKPKGDCGARYYKLYREETPFNQWCSHTLIGWIMDVAGIYFGMTKIAIRKS